MKVNGIIAEYNPFHNGHLYQLEESRHLTEADYTIVVMSGDFVQRGAPAMLDKHVRARMALLGGADLVLELPVLYALSSAEQFAAGAVALLDRLGVVTHLCFGSECGDAEALGQIAGYLLEEPDSYRSHLQRLLRQGRTYPAARAQALCAAFGRDWEQILSSPNNILGIDYIKALKKRKSSILPVTVKRIGAGYHDGAVPLRPNSLQNGQEAPGLRQQGLPDGQGRPAAPSAQPASARAIRQALQDGQTSELLHPYLPAGTARLMEDCLLHKKSVCPDDLSSILYYKLMMQRGQGYEKYLDVSAGLSDRIRNKLGEYTGLESFCEKLKTKDMTYTRISRCLMHILLDIEKNHMETALSLDYTPYARMLGFRRSAAPLLCAIKAHSALSLIAKLADAQNILPADADRMLRQDIFASDVYQGVLSGRTRLPTQNEYTAPLVILPDAAKT